MGPEVLFLPEPILTLHINQTPMSNELHTVQQPTWEDVVMSAYPELPDSFTRVQLLGEVMRRFPKLCLRTPKIEEVLDDAVDRIAERRAFGVTQAQKKSPGRKSKSE